MKTRNLYIWMRTAFTAVALLLGIAAYAADTPTIIDSGTCGAEGNGSNLKWTLTSDGTLTISGTGAMKNYSYYITSERSAAPWAGSHFSELKHLVLEEGITSVGSYAFAGCSGFSGSLTIPNSVTSIGDDAFRNCRGFSGPLTIPNSVTSIGLSAFEGCSGFTGSLTIPNSVTSIGYSAFSDCSGFTGTLTIPNSVTTIGAAAFEGCSGFTGSLTIPDGVTKIGANAFSGCSGFTGSLTIPNSVTSIGRYAFSGCNGFTGTLTIGDGVTEIGEYAFYNCSGFTGSLTIGNSVTSIGADAFYGCSGFTGSLTIPNSVTSIGAEAFYGCSGFTGTLTIGDSVTTIGDLAFYNCRDIDKLDIKPTTPPYVSYEAFGGTTGKVAYIPNGTRTTYESSSWGGLGLIFMDGEDMKVVLNINVATPGTLLLEIRKHGVMPTDVAKLTLTGTLNDDDWAVICKNMPLLYSLDLSGIENTTMPSLGMLKRIYEFAFPQKLVSIPTQVLSSNITGTLTIPESVTKISDRALYNCCHLTGSLTIPDRVTEIGSRAFYQCTDFTGSLTIGESVTSIGNEAFSGCSGLTGEVVLPNKATTIYSGCLSMTGINAIVFGKSVTSIPSDIVEDCSIDSITCYSLIPPSVDAKFFDVNTETCKLRVPKGYFNDYALAPVWQHFRKIVEIDLPTDMYIVKTTTNNGNIKSTETSEVLEAAVVEKDSILALQVVAEEGYRLATLTIDGTDYTANVAEDGSFSTPAVTKDMNIEAVFTQITYTVSIYTVGSGTVTQHDIPYGSPFSMKVKADDKHVLKSVKVSGEEMIDYLGEDGTLDVTDISQDIDIVIDATEQGTPTDYSPTRQSSSLTVWSADGKVFVSADGVIEGIELLDVNGRIVCTATPHTTVYSVAAPQRNAAYIVRVRLEDGGEYHEKVIVR